MMSFDQILRERRSIRRYTPETPDRLLVNQMLGSACLAPSPSHSEPVRFLLIDSVSIKDALKKNMALGKEGFLAQYESLGASKKIRNLIRAYYRFSEFMFSAPYLFALGTKNVMSFQDRLQDAGLTVDALKKNKDLDLATGLSLSAFILKGTELGIATCILTAPLVYIRDVSDILGTDLRITCFVTAGFADEKASTLQRITAEEICQTV
ncbi:MAG: nitroreductase family protein [Proteobacteria bacterium]|nr:nitroreductase family protein [Pseudomonadota bacterium]